MEFRWVALIALWTFLVGPILAGPAGPAARKSTSAVGQQLASPADRAQR